MNAPDLEEAFAAFFSPKSIVLFLVGAVVLAVVGNAAYAGLTNVFGTGTVAQLALAGVTLVLLVAAALLSALVTARPGSVRPLVKPTRHTPKPRRGLVFLFGRPEVCRQAVAAHGDVLERLWLVCTPQNKADAYAFAGELGGTLSVDFRVVEDANDPLEFYKAVQSVFDARPAGWAIDDLIADYVGLTSHASVGMVLACLSIEAPVQYTPGEYDANLRAIRPLPPFEVVLQGRRTPPPPAPSSA